MKGLHIADLHLDRPFEGIHFYDESLMEQLAQSSDQLLRNIENLAFEENVDAVFYVGDTFHRLPVSIDIQKRWYHHLQRLIDANIQPFIVFGNHDYNKAGGVLIPEEAIIWESEEVETKYWTTSHFETVAISAFSYQHPHLENDMASLFPPRDVQVDYHIGLYHGQNSGCYAPFRLETMLQKQYDYWALGHIHQTESLSERIYYSGTPQGKTRKDFNRGNVILFELQEDNCHVEWIDIAPVHYEIKNSEELHYQWKYDGLELIDLAIDVSGDESFNTNGSIEEYVIGISPIDTDKFVIGIKEGQPAMDIDSRLQEELQAHYQQEEIFVDLLSELNGDEYQPFIQQLIDERQVIISDALYSFDNDLKGD